MLDKLKKMLGLTEAATSGTAADVADARIHPRYNLEDFDFIRLEFPIEQFPKLRDISYGGFALLKTGLSLPEFSDPEISGFLYLFQRSCPIKAKKVHESPDKIGFQFIHDNEVVLVFLRSFLEDMRCGATLDRVETILLSDSFQKKYTLALRGDGPVDLYIDWHDGKLHKALLTQRENKVYQEVRLMDGRIQTGRVLDEEGVAPRMITDMQPDPLALQKSLQILVGALIKRTHGAEPLNILYDSLRAHLKR
ncbi:MAG TPA: hypothetical protein VE954_01055 [Oligoflexus sp.]|uniref:hypothetical protein n=1 Tax=Oligoflexus sp. TaxID=1971216 RepID=UPI002D24E8BD|nr:hypothetical protein [Oligoflexus sp.]HYX31669.1 hypothetical protein [Oligoflexus sp.]